MWSAGGPRGVKTLTALRLYIDALRHARPEQLLYRLRRRVGRLLPQPEAWANPRSREPGVERREQADFANVAGYVCEETKRVERANAVVNGSFVFLNRTATFPHAVSWHDPTQSRLWRFHLHYFDYAVDLGAAFCAEGNTRYWARFKDLVEEWISANRPGRGDGWHPFTISVRIVNWVLADHFFKRPIADDGAFQKHFLASLCAQARYLARNLEYDITGNHLIKNGKGLVFAGTFLRGPECQQWIELGTRVLLEEAQEQILDDGGHYERSPLYHVQVLADYLDVLALIPPERAEHERMLDAVQRMLDYLSAILHPDGTLPLFNDSVLCPEPSPEALFGRAEALIGYERADREERMLAEGSTLALADSGNYVFRAADHFLILDCGAVCPDHLPPHAHCDLLSFELSVEGSRIITNGGTYQYEAGPMRDAFRGTASHNTVDVNGEEQSAIWGSFRVGRRSRVMVAITDSVEAGAYFRGSYAGFERNRIEHTRELFLLPGPTWVFVDSLRRRKGSETLSVTSRVHFDPHVHVADEDGVGRAQRDDVHLELLPLGGYFRHDRGWFSPDFGIKEPNPVLLLEGHGETPLHLGFVIAPAADWVTVNAFGHDENGWRLSLRSDGEDFELGALGAFRSSTPGQPHELR